MTFKELAASDIDAVFLNSDEFANTVIFNGIELKCVIDDDRLLERNDTAPGVYLGERLIFTKSSDLPGKPAVGSRATIDGRAWFVTSVTDNAGMYEIRLGANKT